MKILVDNKDVTKGILISETDEEFRILSYLMPICFGFYFLKDCSVKYNGDEDLIKALIAKYPDATGFGKLNSPKGFVEGEVITELKERKARMKAKMDREEAAKELFSHLLPKE